MIVHLNFVRLNDWMDVKMDFFAARPDIVHVHSLILRFHPNPVVRCHILPSVVPLL